MPSRIPLPRLRSAQLRQLLNIAAYVVLALLPLTAMLTGWRGLRLNGERAAVSKPKLSFGAVRQERFQPKADEWFQRNLGLAGTSITVDNSILYHVFREAKHGSTVRVGRDGVLFIEDDLNYYNKYGIRITGPDYLDALAIRLAALQRALAAQGKALVPVIVPSKTSIYRDQVPPTWAAELGALRPTDVLTYQALTLALAAHGVRYVDARAFILKRPEPLQILWGPQSRHWSNYTGCLIISEVATAYAELTGKPRPPVTCELAFRKPWRTSTYLDLLRLLNALRTPSIVRQEPGVAHAPPPPGPRPSVLMIGTSFCWQLAEELRTSELWSGIYLNYYNSFFYRISDMAEERLKQGSPLWREGTLDKDLYLLDLFEGYLSSGNYIDQFLDQAGPALVAGEKP